MGGGQHWERETGWVKSKLEIIQPEELEKWGKERDAFEKTGRKDMAVLPPPLAH